MKVLHLASFSGNIGDNANHLGFRRWFEKLASQEIIWTNIEMREFFWKERKFDQEFAELANQHDLLVVGGGNYFELWVEHSATGTSVDFSDNLLDRLEIPVFFNALGCDEGQGIPDKCLSKFRHFMERVCRNDRFFVSLRNDGSTETAQKHLKQDLHKYLHTLPDAGFFVPTDNTLEHLLPAGKRYIGINLANDMSDIRFSNGEGGSYDKFCKEFAQFIGKLWNLAPDNEFVFFPHIFRDLEVIYDVINHLPDRLRRTRLIVAPYMIGDQAAQGIFGLYRRCDLVLAMRFHANLCALGQGVPTIGLCSYPQISLFYQENNLSDCFINVKHPDFQTKLLEKAQLVLAKPDAYADFQQSELKSIEKNRQTTGKKLRSWLETNSLITS